MLTSTSPYPSISYYPPTPTIYRQKFTSPGRCSSGCAMATSDTAAVTVVIVSVDVVVVVVAVFAIAVATLSSQTQSLSQSYRGVVLVVVC